MDNDKINPPIHKPIIVSSTPSQRKIPINAPVATTHSGQNAEALFGKNNKTEPNPAAKKIR